MKKLILSLAAIGTVMVSLSACNSTKSVSGDSRDTTVIDTAKGMPVDTTIRDTSMTMPPDTIMKM